MRKVVFDIETKNFFFETGSSDPASLDLAVVCIHDSETDTYSSYFEEELPKLWPILEKTDVLIGFNSDHFDVPLLDKYYSGDLTKIRSLDLLKEVKKSLGRRIKLDTLAEATLGKNKTADGLQAGKWWKEGKHELVRDYCIEDVKITKQLYEFALSNGYVKYKDGKVVKEIKLDTSAWENEPKTTMTHTLPF
jgi:DEAD/DEAH box helicase domain-containing protein